MTLFPRKQDRPPNEGGDISTERFRERKMAPKKTHENASLVHEVARLQHQTVAELHRKYQELFGHESRSNHKQFLQRRIAWRLQANALGDLTERARQRAVALAEEAELRVRAPESFFHECAGMSHRATRDARLPAPGTRLWRLYHGQDIKVEVLEQGFQYQEQVYKSLSAVARRITGTQWNGFAFFGLHRRREQPNGN